MTEEQRCCDFSWKSKEEHFGEVRPFFKSLFVYRVFFRFESQLSPKGNRQIPERISRWQRCSAVIGPDQLPSRALPSRNSLSAINDRIFGKRSKGGLYSSMLTNLKGWLLRRRGFQFLTSGRMR